MQIQWNKVTWYSRWGAIILFMLLIPLLTFYIGMRYQEVQLVTSQVK